MLSSPTQALLLYWREGGLQIPTKRTSKFYCALCLFCLDCGFEMWLILSIHPERDWKLHPSYSYFMAVLLSRLSCLLYSTVKPQSSSTLHWCHSTPRGLVWYLFNKQNHFLWTLSVIRVVARPILVVGKVQVHQGWSKLFVFSFEATIAEVGPGFQTVLV